MVRVVVAARTNRVSARLPVIVSGGLNGYLLSGDGRKATLPPDFVSGVGVQTRFFRGGQVGLLVNDKIKRGRHE